MFLRKLTPHKGAGCYHVRSFSIFRGVLRISAASCHHKVPKKSSLSLSPYVLSTKLFTVLLTMTCIQTELWFSELRRIEVYDVERQHIRLNKATTFIYCLSGFRQIRDRRRTSGQRRGEERMDEEVCIWLNILSLIRWHQWNWSHWTFWIYCWELHILPIHPWEVLNRKYFDPVRVFHPSKAAQWTERGFLHPLYPE